MKKFTIVFTIAFSIIIFIFTLIGCSNKSSSPTGVNENPTATISGTVTDSLAGTPVVGARVTIGTQSTTTDESGSYSLNSVPLGEQPVSITAPGYISYSGKVKVSGTSQTFNFRLTAVKVEIPFSVTLDPSYYAWKLFDLSEYSYYQCSGSGFGNHNVKITIQISSATAPVWLALVRPDGYYLINNSSAEAGFSQTITTNACGNWAVVLWNRGTTQITVSCTIIIDFSNYLPPVNDLASTILVPINYSSIPAGTYNGFVRFMQANLRYSLELNISGGSNNDINLYIYNPDGMSVFSQRVSGSYTSQTFVATKSGFYSFFFDNSFSTISSKSVTGNLKIMR